MPPVIVPVPLTRDWFLGVTNVRGSLFTVVDLRRFAGDGVTEMTKETRLLSLAPSLGFNVTLVVSKMLGLRNTASMTAVVNGSPAHSRCELARQQLCRRRRPHLARTQPEPADRDAGLPHGRPLGAPDRRTRPFG